jgi:2-haloacid dehalogenase
LVEAASLEGIVSEAISADGVQTYKPDPGIYRYAADRIGTDIGDILHVSGGSMRDVWGAKHAGMRTAWLNRPEKQFPRESLGMAPDWEIESFLDLADRLTGTSEV